MEFLPNQWWEKKRIPRLCNKLLAPKWWELCILWILRKSLWVWTHRLGPPHNPMFPKFMCPNSCLEKLHRFSVSNWSLKGVWGYPDAPAGQPIGIWEGNVLQNYSGEERREEAPYKVLLDGKWFLYTGRPLRPNQCSEIIYLISSRIVMCKEN